MSPDGREALRTEAREILGRDESRDEKRKDIVDWFPGVPSAKGPARQRMKPFPSDPPRLSRPRRRETGPSAAVPKPENTGESAKELHEALNAIVADVGGATRELLERRMLETGATVPLPVASVDEGARLRDCTPSRDRRMTRNRPVPSPPVPPLLVLPAGRVSGPVAMMPGMTAHLRGCS